MTIPIKLDEEQVVASVRRLCASVCARVQASDSLEEVETSTREGLDALGRALMTYAVQAGDIDAPEVLINGTRHSKVRRYRDEVHTTFGPVEVTKTSYRKDMQTRPVAVMDGKLGLVEGKYTPKTARILCLLTALAVRDDVAAILGEFGGMKMGAATMYRVPQFVASRYEVERVEIEREVRERAAIPATAAIVQFGLDGVMVPQEGEHCDPRGRTPRGDPEPPRHERRVGALPASPRDCDGKLGVAWHEASVATAAFFDAEGRHLATTYLGRMPEPRGSGRPWGACTRRCPRSCRRKPSGFRTSSTSPSIFKTLPTPSTAPTRPKRGWHARSGPRFSAPTKTGSTAYAEPCCGIAASSPAQPSATGSAGC